MSQSILVIDDEVSIRESLAGALQDENYSVRLAASGEEGIEIFRAERPDVVLLDVWMPGGRDGIETLREIRALSPDAMVIVMSGHGTIETAVKATKMGAYDFLEKPLSLERLLVVLNNVQALQDLARENALLRSKFRKNTTIIGESAGVRAMRNLIEKAAPTTASILITGENGCGKELVANQIHALSHRAQKPFVEVNCAAIPEDLIESELFGHERGAFTGATQLRRGKFDLAHGGTLFLDEIGDMSLRTQAKILRVLQEQKFERVGGVQTITVDVRIVAATNKDLKAEIQKGAFREDLYFRLNVVPFAVPPLRERKEDIALLAQHFLFEFSQAHGRMPRTLGYEAKAALEAYRWPGNVRELKNFIERLTILGPDSADGQPLTVAEILAHLDTDEIKTGDPQSLARGLREARQDFEKDFIMRTLRDVSGNVSRAATTLGIERSYLHRKIRSYGIDL